RGAARVDGAIAAPCCGCRVLPEHGHDPTHLVLGGALLGKSSAGRARRFHHSLSRWWDRSLAYAPPKNPDQTPHFLHHLRRTGQGLHSTPTSHSLMTRLEEIIARKQHLVAESDAARTNMARIYYQYHARTVIARKITSLF